MTRGSLLKAGGLALFAVALPGGTRVLSLLPGDLFSGVPAHLRRATYFPHVGTRFRIFQRGARPLDVTLRKVGDLSPARAGRDDSFSLLFRGPARAGFVQDSRLTVLHPALGRLHLSVNPLGARRRGHYYEAIVNRGS